MECLTKMFPELLKVLFLLTQSFIPRTCGLKNSFKSAFPSQSVTNCSMCLYFGDKGKVAQWWLEVSSMCLSQIYCACLLLPILNFVISDITRCLFQELCLYPEILKRLGFFMCGSSGQQNQIMARFTLAYRTHQSASHNGLSWAVLLPQPLLSLWLMAQGY